MLKVFRSFSIFSTASLNELEHSPKESFEISPEENSEEVLNENGQKQEQFTENSRTESEDEFFEVAPELISSKSFSIESSSVLPRIYGRPRTENIKTSSESSAIKSFRAKHFPNSSKTSLPFWRNKKFENTFSPVSPISNTESTQSIIVSLKDQLSFHNSKAVESKERVQKLSKSVDTLRNKLSELQKCLRLKDVELEEKNERNKATGKIMNQQREKIKKLQFQLDNFKTISNELREELRSKADKVAELETKNQSLKQKSKLMMMSNESLLSELKLISSKDDNKWNKEPDFEQKIENLEIELNSRDLKIDILNLELNQLKEENNSLKYQIYEITTVFDDKYEAGDVTRLNREIFRLKNKEIQLKDEVRRLITQLEQQQNYLTTTESQMQLRGNFVMTVQDYSQSKHDNARLILQVNNMEKIIEEEEENDDAAEM